MSSDYSPAAEWSALVLLLAALAFGPALNNDYVFDDVPQVRALPPAQEIGDWVKAAAEPWWDRETNPKFLWRPLTRLFILGEKSLAEELGAAGNPRIYRIFSVLLHGLACVLALLLAKALGLGWSGAGASAVLLAVHPLRSEAVHQIVGQAELLAAAIMTAGMISYVRSRSAGASWRRLALVQSIYYALALGAKEHAAVYPVFLALIEGTRTDGPSGSRVSVARDAARATLSLSPVLVLFLCCKAIVTGGIIEGPAMVQSYENIFGTMSFGERSPGAFGALAYLLVKTFLPLGLSPDYSAESLPVELGWRWPLSVAGVCAGIGLLLYCRANLRRGGRGWALALAGVASYCLVSNLFFTIGVTLALRLVYLPLTAVGLGAGWAWARWRDSALARRRLRSGLAPLPDLVLAATVALLLAATWNFAPAWRTEADYARRTLAQFPRSWRANQNLAALLYVERDFEAGLQHARTALILRPEEAVSWDTLGVNATFVPGHEAEAEAALRKAIELNPLLSLPYKHLRYLFSRSNRSGECSPF